MSFFNTEKYSLSEFKPRGSGYQGIRITSSERDYDIDIFPADAFELGCRLIDWVRSQSSFHADNYSTTSKINKNLTFEFVDHFTYKITELNKIVGMVFWSNSSSKWKSMLKNFELKLENKYRYDLFNEVQAEYDKIHS